MRKIFAKTQKVELNSFINEFVKTRQKFFTPDQEWIEADLSEEKIYVRIDEKQLEKELDEMVKCGLENGKANPLKMLIQVRKNSDGVEISYSDNGAGNWRNRSLQVSDHICKGSETKKEWGMQIA